MRGIQDYERNSIRCTHIHAFHVIDWGVFLCIFCRDQFIDVAANDLIGQRGDVDRDICCMFASDLERHEDQMSKTFTSMKQFREYFFPNWCKEDRKPKQTIVIIPRPSA